MGKEIHLEVYPDSSDTATGDIYFDDGNSLQYSTARDSYSAWHSFTFSNGTLKSDIVWGGSYVNVPSVDAVKFYGVSKKPSSVTDSTGGALTTIYEASTYTLYVKLA